MPTFSVIWHSIPPCLNNHLWTQETYKKLVAKAKDDIIKEVNDRLPRKVGVVAVNHFKQNFRDSGWLDNGLHLGNGHADKRAQGPMQDVGLCFLVVNTS